MLVHLGFADLSSQLCTLHQPQHIFWGLHRSLGRQNTSMISEAALLVLCITIGEHMDKVDNCEEGSYLGEILHKEPFATRFVVLTDLQLDFMPTILDQKV